MAFKLLSLEVLVDFPNNNISARICRHDGKTYDLKTKKFQPDSYFGSGAPSSGGPSQLIPLIPGTGLNQWIVKNSVEINPTEFPDGDYSIYYHDSVHLDSNSIPRLFDVTQVSIFNGDSVTQKVPSTTDIAIRLLESRVGTTTVRNTLLGSQSRFSKVDEMYQLIKNLSQ